MSSTGVASPALRALIDRFGDRVSTRLPERTAYAHDLWPRSLISAPDVRPDAIVWPTSTEEVVAIINIARAHQVPIVPFGAGSGVCGAAQAIAGGWVVDLKRMNRVLAVDPEAGTMTAQAGILGELLERELAQNGVTLGHFPSSIMCSTFGGWLATRSSGQLSTKYGKIEDMVQAMTFVDGRGETHELDASDSPNLLPLLIGSEGTLGIITQARCTVRAKPEVQLYRGWTFPRVAAGCEAIRRLLQRGLRPAAVRLYDELDSFLHRRKDAKGSSQPSALERMVSLLSVDGTHAASEGRRFLLGLALSKSQLLNQLGPRLLGRIEPCLLIVGFEGEATLTKAEAEVAAEELTRAGGKDLGEEPGLDWLAHRYDVSFRMSKVFEAGAFVDTMEIATTWEKLLPLYHAVREAIAPHAFVMAHFSHAYEDGCSIYFTFVGRGDTEEAALTRYDQIWSAGLGAVIAVGGTISHHHGIGRSKASFLPAELGPGAMRLSRALKRTLDPNRIMNPGNLGS